MPGSSSLSISLPSSNSPRLALRRLPQNLKSLFEASDLLFGLLQMVAETCLKIGVGGALDHFGQCFHNLFLGVVNVAETFDEQSFQCFLFNDASFK